MTAAALEGGRTRRPAKSLFGRLVRQPMAAAGLAIVGLFVAAALLAPVLPLADPDATAPALRLRPPFSGHGLLGTDQLGRDIFSRIVWGLRVSLAVGAVSTLSAAAVGSLIGLLAAFYGRLVDGVLMRLIDVLMAFPYLLLALAVVAALGPGLANAALAIAIVNVPFFARAVRGAALSVVGQDYVAAARMAGLSDAKILISEVFPNVAPLIAVTAATTIGWMILETAGLSFLGLGAQPPQADLGSMLGDGRKVLAATTHVAAAPGLAIFVLVVGLNLLGDGLRDLLDPRMADGATAAPSPATTVSRDAPYLAPAGRGRRAAPGEGTFPYPESPRAPSPAAADAASTSPRWGEVKEEDPLLAIEGLTTAFDGPTGRHAAVRDLHLALKPGEAIGVVGESGSGKSVAALSVTRLAPSPPGVIVAGRVLFDGDDLAAAPFERLRAVRGGRIAYVFQDPSTTLNPLMTVGRQIAEAVFAHRPATAAEAESEARRLIASVDLPDPERVVAAYPHQLSGGQRQRIAIAMALANDPDVLIADEPTTALDATTQALVLELFSKLRRERGAALIFVSHDFSVIKALCERVVVMYAGEIVEQGPTAAVLASPRHPYAARLIACAPKLGEPDRALEAIEGAPPALDERPDGCAFAPRCRLAIDDCRAGPIALVDLGEGRAARCIRTDEVAHGRA